MKEQGTGPVFLSGPGMWRLADAVGQAMRATHLASTNAVDGIRWEVFADGYPNLMIRGVADLRGRDVVFFASFQDPADIFPQLGVIYALPDYGVRSLKVVLPYFPTATMERVDYEGQIATAKTLARVLSAIPLTLSGPAEIIIFDIHALQERFYFGDFVRKRLENTVPLMDEVLYKEAAILLGTLSPAGKDLSLAVAFPDEGARKRFTPSFAGTGLAMTPTIVCSKIRSSNGVKVRVIEGEVSGRHVLIVDDLVQSGGTLLACKDALLASGAASVSAYATHGVFPKDAWKKFVDTGFARIWITDSCPLTLRALDLAPSYMRERFKVMSLAPLIAKMV